MPLSVLRRVYRLAREARSARSQGTARSLRVDAYSLLVRHNPHLMAGEYVRIVKRFFDGVVA